MMLLRPTMFFVLFAFFVVQSPALPGEEIKRMQPLLGTYVEITAEGDNKEELQEAVDKGFDAVRKVDRLLSSFRQESELSKINRFAGLRPVAVSPWTFECLEKAVEIGNKSKGAFDITCRPLLDLWGFLRREYRLPEPEERKFALELVGFRKLELKQWPSGRLSEPRRTAYLSRRAMTIDVGGIGKGFAVDKAVEALKNSGVQAGLVRAWGDCFGFGGKMWTVEIERGKTVTLHNEAVSTSGSCENFFELNGKRYAHILDPRTGMPIQGMRSVTVKAPTCAESDAWATAIFVDPRLRPAGIQVVRFEKQ